MGSPEGEKGFFTGAIRTGDTVQIDHHRVWG
jgi:dihydroxyacid dehydratase/phosphogluconate dehydratase